MHVHKTLSLPLGYQHFSWYDDDNQQVDLPNKQVAETFKNPSMQLLQHALKKDDDAELRLYTQHQIFHEEGILKHTRSSPNWDGGFVTYATCKHLMRTYKTDWVGTWIAGLCPADCQQNTLLFVGCCQQQFESNYHLFQYLRGVEQAKYKLATNNPRGDIYTPRQKYLKNQSPSFRFNWFDHTTYHEPKDHTRSVEFYKKSAGSVSLRKDGLIPKWWRDVEYIQHGVRPGPFILSPCFIFSKPMLWSSFVPGRAALKLTARTFLDSLSSSPRE